MNVRAPLLVVMCALLPGCASGPTPVPAAGPSTDAAAAMAEPAATTEPAASAPVAPPSAQLVAADPIDFDLEVRPILEANCRLCHFEGGKMYERMPFDQAETIRTLGEALFTRIKEEGDQAVIRGFLARAGAEAAPAAAP